MNLTVIIVISAAALFLGMAAYLFLYFIGFRKTSSGVEQDLNKLKQEYALLNKSVEILRDLSSQYFVTLNENGFGELCNIESALSETIDCCSKFLESRNVDSVEQIISYVYIKRGKSAAPPCLWGIMGDRASHLIDWSDRAKELLVSLIESINETSNDLKVIGGAARRKRKSTVLMLNEARSALGAI